MPYIAYAYLGLLAIMSILTLCFFAADKHNSSREGKGRVPEIVLLSLCGFGGALGAAIGMYVLRHKTNPVTKFHFTLTLFLSLAVQVGLAALMVIRLF